MIETRESCELLYFEAANIQRIYKTYQGVMERLLPVETASSSSISPESDDLSDGTGNESIARDSELALAGVTLYQLIKDHFKELIKYRIMLLCLGDLTYMYV